MSVIPSTPTDQKMSLIPTSEGTHKPKTGKVTVFFKKLSMHMNCTDKHKFGSAVTRSSTPEPISSSSVLSDESDPATPK